MQPENFSIACLTPTASAPGANANTYPIFNSVTASLWGAGNLHTWCNRIEFTLANNAAGTLKVYRSTDKGTNWDQYGGDISWAASTATDVNGPEDILVDPHFDVKIDWVNGGVAQTTWRPSLVGIRGYHGVGG